MCGCADSHAPRYVGTTAGSWRLSPAALGLLAGVTGILVLGEEQHGVAAGITLYGGGEALKELHEAWPPHAGVVIIHLLGVLRKAGCIRRTGRAMLTGARWRGQRCDSFCHYLAGGVLLLLTAVFGAWFFRTTSRQAAARPSAIRWQDLADNKVWREECGSCHLAFHPTLLPARSWARLMQEQNTHFGEPLDWTLPPRPRFSPFCKNTLPTRN